MGGGNDAGAGELLTALVPFLGPADEERERLVEELGTFLEKRGLPSDERAGRRVIAAGLDALGPELLRAFAATHLPSHVSLPRTRLEKLGRRLASALAAARTAGLSVPDGAEAALRSGLRELPRLDRAAKALRALAVGDRPGKALFRKDPAAYAAAMRAWELSRPRADEEQAGPFEVELVGEDRARLRQGEQRLWLDLPPETLALLREGDRLEVLLGRQGSAWFVADAFSVAAR